MSRYAAPDSQAWVALLVRLLVGWIFLIEGIQRFLFPAAFGAGRFASLGIPWPQFAASGVGGVEVICGLLLLIGLLTRPAAFLLLLDLLAAIVLTKVPLFVHHGFWPAMQESRVDYCMLLGLLAILTIGPGRLSCDTRRFFEGA